MKENLKRFVLAVLFLSNAAMSQAQTLRGTVTDASTGEVLIGASVHIKGTLIGTITDIDGNFSISDLTDGKYTAVISYIFYKTEEVDVEVSPDSPIHNIVMEMDGEQLDAVVVTARKNLENERFLQMERMNSTIAIENIGAKEMSIKGISNVQEGVKKITGISVASAGQLIVRGLGDRYSLTTLNGLPIASPNPDNKLIPLDLFPSSTVQNITVSKVYDAASYADCSGAHIEITTKENVEQDFLHVGFSTGGAFNTIGRARYQMDRNGTLFGKSSVSQDVFDMPLRDFDNYARENDIFNTTFGVSTKNALPSLGGNISAGKNFNVGGQTLSVLLAGNVSNDYQNIANALYKTLEATGNEQSNFSYDSYAQYLKVAALGYAGYTLRESDRIGYTFFYARNASDTYQHRSGVDAEGHDLLGSNNTTHIYSLQNHQVNGIHDLLDNSMELEWGASYGMTSSEEPDRRQVMFINEDGSLKLFKLNRQETMRYFGNLSESELNARAAMKWKWNEKSFLKVGINYKDRSRDYMGVRFYYNLNKLNPEIQNIYSADSYINMDGVRGGIVIERKKQPKDSYRAGSRIIAGYILTDFYPIEDMLVNLGVRYEYSMQNVSYASDGGDWYSKRRNLDVHDFFPALNMKYAISDDHSLRFAASRTVTRPSFIEMAPFLYQESYGSEQIRGNEELRNGYNYNADLKYEWFGHSGDMFSVTGYFKYLDNPIERIQELNGGATQHSFRNAENGIATGVELEFRKELFKDFRIGANASYMYTNVKLPLGGAYTNKERPLQGASPILLNADLTWCPRLKNDGQLNFAIVYNLQGSRIHAVGVSQLGDIKQLSVHTLNFSFSYDINDDFSLKMRMKDLLGSVMVFVQEVPVTGQILEVERFEEGSSFELGVNYKF